MNMFHLDTDIQRCAQAHHDKHVSKMAIESGQMLSTSIWVLDCDFAETATAYDMLYLPAYEKHPCTKWVYASLDNFKHMVSLMIALCDECVYRGFKQPSTMRIVPAVQEWIATRAHKINFQFDTSTPVAYAINNERCSAISDPVEAYRQFYIEDKLYTTKGDFMAYYTRREVPSWMVGYGKQK